MNGKAKQVYAPFRFLINSHLGQRNFEVGSSKFETSSRDFFDDLSQDGDEFIGFGNPRV